MKKLFRVKLVVMQAALLGAGLQMGNAVYAHDMQGSISYSPEQWPNRWASTYESMKLRQQGRYRDQYRNRYSEYEHEPYPGYGYDDRSAIRNPRLQNDNFPHSFNSVPFKRPRWGAQQEQNPRFRERPEQRGEWLSERAYREWARYQQQMNMRSAGGSIDYYGDPGLTLPAMPVGFYPGVPGLGYPFAPGYPGGVAPFGGYPYGYRW